MKNSLTAEQIQKLANDFSALLREWLTPEEMEEVNRRNKTPEYNGFCASHDFCDANQAMIDICEKAGIDFMGEITNDIWNAAKANNFEVK